MILPALATTLVLFGADPQVAPSTAQVLLPRSSIAAVLAQRGELGLTDGEVSELERRDEALQERIAELRDQSAAAARQGSAPRPAGTRPSQGGEDAPLSPTDAARPDGAGSGRRGGFGGGQRSPGKGASSAQDPARRAAELQARLDDADTAAWLSAEAALAESRRERARDVAEKYREQLADQREAERAKRAHGPMSAP